jgi:uncharacterized circularly permuted ATP-grasp superfamily protein
MRWLKGEDAFYILKRENTMNSERTTVPVVVERPSGGANYPERLPRERTIDEMYGASGEIRTECRFFYDRLRYLSSPQIDRKRKEAERLFRRLGITFNVYGESASTERLIPFDVIPRIVPASTWQTISTGLRQRIRALNAFLHDVYHRREILDAGLIPAEMVVCNPQYRGEMLGIDVPGGVYAHIAGFDLVHTGEDEFYILEDNLRTPSGVSYMLVNRLIMMRLFPELFERQPIASVDRYPELLLKTLRSVAPEGVRNPTVVLLTPGHYNSAFFEHAFLAQQMGIELVEARDLFVNGNAVYMRTTDGPVRVDVMYRRIDDEFLDPLAYRPDSMLGVPGLLSVYRSGGVTLANAVGAGVADDKAIYAFVPDMIRFYLGEEPILKNVPTYQLRRPEDRDYALAHLNELVVKEVHGSGGYGMLIGPASTREERALFRRRILQNPDRYIAQPTLTLSTCPTFVEQGIAPRHVDLRPFILSGQTIHMVPGGLTRVALRDGSMVVNSSQGGGTKDTWVLEE